MITIVTGEDLRARGVNDLRTALALVAGVDVAPGGDTGPAGSVPGMWGLREFDAFLLVVDGVPSGGAFNPALATLDLTNVERIEVLRGAAPVSYGATSFVGVIHVIHYAPGSTPETITFGGGTRATAISSITSDLGDWGPFKQSFTANAETREFSQDDSQVNRVHMLYRNSGEFDWGRLHFDVDGTYLHQDPYSPHPREGNELTDRIPLGANHNPSDAKADEDRITFTAGMDHPLAGGDWVTTFSLTHANQNNIRGFLRDDFEVADGFRQHVSKTDAYFDTYFATKPMDNLRVMFGADWLYGWGEQKSSNFEYPVLPDGSNRPNSQGIQIDEKTRLEDERNFGGLYVQADWQPVERLNIVAGVRFNHTDEDREGQVFPSEELQEEEGAEEEESSDSRNKSKVSGVIGASYAFWQDANDKLVAFADYRNTYKPAAVDFGPEAEGEILEPETADSWEVGLKGRHLDGRFEWEASYFHMDFENLVIAENIDGLPALANAGTERFTGAEFEASWMVTPDLRLAGSYAYHQAKFEDYARLRPDGSIQQLGGKFLELSPEHLGAVGLIWRPMAGLNGYAVWNYVGERFLNKGNTARADSYSTLDAGLGYRFPSWELRLDGYNLSDERDPVAESELGDAQFYRLPGRTAILSATFAF